MTRIWMLVGLIGLLAVAACSAGTATLSLQHTSRDSLVAQLAQYTELATHGATRAARLAAAKTGRGIADRCVQQSPRDALCYYHRAVLTGEYYRLHIFGYQRGLKQMIADCERINQLDPLVGEAGGYRILGQIFAQVPQTAARPGDIVRDLDAAVGYFAKAVAYAPASVDNAIAYCDALTMLEDWAAARRVCADAAHKVAARPQHPDSAEWRHVLQDAKKRLARRGAEA
ncbi:MAG: hypothetical protein HY696_03575 [Deltaproteobacteria bacterium]|nr:hypothetical protein [Deltaproteobacteria bacterium]